MVSWSPQAAVASEHLGNVLRSGLETRELKAPKEAKIPAPIAFPCTSFMSRTTPGVGDRR